ncbi:MAG: ATP-binding protein, partial [Deltaproteobacteria bacterium]
ITTNLAYEEWHNFLGNKALVEALLSRLRHQCQTVRIDGPSLRDPTGCSGTHPHNARPAAYRPTGRVRVRHGARSPIT